MNRDEVIAYLKAEGYTDCASALEAGARLQGERKRGARGKFVIGQAVKMSALGEERLLRWSKKRRSTGVVVGFGRKSNLLVRVKVDGLKSIGCFHIDFWEPSPPQGAQG